MELLKYGWKFSKSDNARWETLAYDDSSWREVRVPHDYAIEGPFDRNNDTQVVGIAADGIKKNTNHVGRTGGLPINDRGYYRKHIYIEADTRRAFIEFDGVMCNSSIYLNGHYVGGRPYGYVSFEIEITQFMQTGDNLLAVVCAPEQCASRWYAGAGIYRNVRLKQLKNDVCLDFFANYITSDIVGENAKIVNRVYIRNNDSTVTVRSIVKANGEIKANVAQVVEGNYAEIDCHLENYQVWSIDTPYLYDIETVIERNGEVLDSNIIKYGIRDVKVDSEGFYLNGNYTKIKGVCMHHDLGAIGTAINVSAIRRQLNILKSFGVNAIRTSHNPPTPELLDLCDSMGFMVMDEAFDEWGVTKVINGYAKHFRTWSKADIESMVKRDRNHACIIMWSIGNEIMEQCRITGGRVAKRLALIVRQCDPTRPITCGFNAPKQAIANRLDRKLDILGLNYQPKRYDYFHTKRKKLAILGSETSSCVSSRGEYYFPVAHEYPVDVKDTLLMSSYDLCGPGWACSPDEEFYYQDKHKYVIGEFVWTGFDYLGEPTPYYNNWPCRSSYFGIVDLAGMPKDRYYVYKSQWNKAEDTIHIFPHWNFESGQLIDVHCYSNYAQVELFLNGKSLGICTKGEEPLNKYRLVWKGVPFEAGELRAEAVEKRSVCDIVKTADTPYSVRLTPETDTILADGDELAYIRCDIVDKNGIVCPKANYRVDITVNGAGEYVAADNGKQTDTRTFSEKYCDTFNGSCIIIARSIEGAEGDITVTAEVDGLASSAVIIKAIKK